jgi:glycosyltransferase involved in cell wall biosynthesis
MRVLHIVSQVGTYGGERFVPALARAQRRAGIDARILTIYDGAPVDDVVVGSCGRSNARGARGGGPAFFFRLFAALRRERPDVVHTHLAHAKHWGRLAAFLAGATRVIHTEHANAFDDLLPKRLLTRALHRRTAFIVALSEPQRERIIEHEGASPARVVVIPNGVDLTTPVRTNAREQTRLRSAIGVPQGAKLLLAVGRLDAVKRYDLALETLALLPSDAHLVVAGDGPERNALLERASELGISHRFHALGYRSDIPQLLAVADLVLNTSRSEAMPLSLLEAICAGVGVVATPWPGARELLGERCVAAAARADALASCIVTNLFAQDAVRRPSSEERNAHSIDRAAARYVALYDRSG